MQSSKVRMEIERGARRAGRPHTHVFSRHEDMFISTLLVGNNVVLVIYGITISILINPFLEDLFHNEGLVLILQHGHLHAHNPPLQASSCRRRLSASTPNFMMRLLSLPLFLIYVVLLSGVIVHIVDFQRADEAVRHQGRGGGDVWASHNRPA